MAHIELHDTLPSHLKLQRFARLLDLRRLQGQQARILAMGHLVALWLWTIRHRPGGDLGDMSPAEIAAAAEWPADPESFLSALRGAGWLDAGDTLSLHDWSDYTKNYHRAQRERERMSNFRRTVREQVADGDARRTRTVREPYANGARTVAHCSSTVGVRGEEKSGAEQNRAEKKGEGSCQEGSEPDRSPSAAPPPKPPESEAVETTPPTSEAFRAAWNALSELRRIGSWSPARERLWATCCRETEFLREWRHALIRAAASPFLRGENDRGWRMGPEWFLRTGSLDRILEGEFDARAAPLLDARGRMTAEGSAVLRQRFAEDDHGDEVGSVGDPGDAHGPVLDPHGA